MDKIAGYRELDADTVATINAIKALGVAVGQSVDAVAANPLNDARWAAIARTQLQQGFMALTRAVAKPTTF